MSITASGTVTADAPDGGISTGLTTSLTKTFTESAVVSAGPTLRGRLQLHPAPREQAKLTQRLSEHIVVSVSAPVIAAGQPRTPAYVAAGSASAAATLGIGHIRSFDDPDPVWNGASYDVAPPPTPTGSSLVRWSVRTLPDPAAHGGAYSLGTRDSYDGTSGLPAAAGQWDSAPGSAVSMPWTSTYPFKPTVSDHYHFGNNGKSYHVPAALLFSAHQVQSMFLDAATLPQPPFTLMVVAAILAFPQRNYRHWVLDAAADPGSAVSTAARKRWWNTGVKGTTRLSEDYGYRTALSVMHDHVTAFTDPTPVNRVGRVPFHNNGKPKVFGLCVNGAASFVSLFTKDHRHKRPVHFSDHGVQRFLTLGRRNGVLDQSHASHMAVLEVRLVDDALTEDQVWAHSIQLATTWKLPEYPA